jgi:peptide/nickel transport system substrate-binding protein
VELAVAAPLLALTSYTRAPGAGAATVGPARAQPGASSLRVALPADPASLNPLIQTGLVEASVRMNVFDGLATLDADGAVQPALAESWEVLDDRTWEFRLRPGVTFHNGEPFDSTAVRFTVETMLDPASRSPVRAQLAAIDHVETPDPLIARIVTQQPFPPLLAELTALAILPPGHTASVGMDGLDRRPVGTGPYRFVEWVQDERIALEADRDHWRGVPSIDQVTSLSIPENATRLAALQAGQVDLATNVTADQVSSLNNRGLQVLARPGIQTLYLRLNARRPPLDDVRVRRALACAIDVDTIIATLYGGHARRVAAPFPPDVFGYDAGATPVAYDPDRARALLAEAGHDAGITLTFETPQGRYPGDAQVPLAIAGDLEKVGVQARLMVVEWAAYLQKVTAGQGEDRFLLAGTNRTFDPHFAFARLYAGASSFGRDYYGRADIDPLVAEAATTLDRERREALYHRLLDILRADVPAVWLAQLDDIYGARLPGKAGPRR